MNQTFDKIAESYDQWYDSPEGEAILNVETKCLKRLGGSFAGRWLELGVGTGRFASKLGIIEGIDPSFGMLKIAAARGIHACTGRAESLPFPDESFDGVLMALSLCFIREPERALNECFRILQPAGLLLLGIVSSDSSWGELYAKKKAMGHPIYSLADFRSSLEIISATETAGFSLLRKACTLFWKPDSQPESNPRVDEGISPNAGFLGLLFSKKK
ncbi:MAG: class I SAM-dependent methyltransferase [Pseudomonadota bacterium]